VFSLSKPQNFTLPDSGMCTKIHPHYAATAHKFLVNFSRLSFWVQIHVKVSKSTIKSIPAVQCSCKAEWCLAPPSHTPFFIVNLVVAEFDSSKTSTLQPATTHNPVSKYFLRSRCQQLVSQHCIKMIIIVPFCHE